jgi:multidrug transporter EmrE-like cation transporter
MSKAGESTPLPGGWALWAGIATVLAAAAGWLLFRSKGKGKGKKL